MTTEIDMLNSIHENADMGLNGLSHILSMSTDPALTKELKNQKSDYEEALQKSEEMLRARHVYHGKEVGTMAKMMSGIMAKAKNLADPSTSKLAEMIFQGNNMGVTELTRQLNDYRGEDKEVLDFAKEQLKREEKHAETMKKFL